MKGPLIYYSIKEWFGSDLSNTKLASSLRKNIEEDVELNFNVELDFKGVRSVTNGWARNLIGKLIKDNGEDYFKNHVLLSNMNKNVRVNILEGIEQMI